VLSQSSGVAVRSFSLTRPLTIVWALLVLACSTLAQNVTTQHNDLGRTGAYTTETVLTLPM